MDKSDHVRDMYWSAPTMLLYSMISSGSPSVRDNFSVEDNGVGEDLQLSIPNLVNKSVAYFSCVKIKPSWIFLTLMPKKNCKSPSSFIAKKLIRSLSKAGISSSEELVTMISST